MGVEPISPEHIEAFIARWIGTAGGAERANYQMYLSELVALLDLPKPDPATHETELNDYVFERFVRKTEAGDPAGTGRIDLYKRGCFVLEAKQSRWKGGKKHKASLDQAALPEIAEKVQHAPAKYDVQMRDARKQAEDYARALPASHGWPPFIIVCDVGRAFELYFDWSGMGKDYGFFPDKQHYRIELAQLRTPDVQATLRAVWTDPRSIDPRLKAAEVTRGIAKRLADVSAYLEQSNRPKARTAGLESMMIEETSLFLMRIIFCMFAEDIGLLPKDRFKAFLEDTVENQTRFEQGLHDLWTKMNARGGGFAWAVDDAVRWFNGGLFESNTTYVLSNADRGELLAAAKADWRKVEPAIFGTLLEQALTTEERAKLGAHYTPRPYVERLVDATIMQVLNGEWAEAEERIEAALPDEAAAGAIAEAFHEKLAGIRVLDPACGTGNFLYVAMELMQRLESRVIDAIQRLGGEAHPRIGPQQFYGLEKNPRAAKIAELVLWIGWLRFRIRNNPEDVPEPVLARSANINFGRHGGFDAVLRQTETGEPDLDEPMVPAWPEAEFIVGNPPFIGKGAAMRSALGSNYVDAMAKANPRVGGSADFVMQWWDRAALILTRPGTRLRRFGFVTTNSITQGFNRRVMQRYLNSQDGEGRLSLVYAIPDHPWTKASRDAAAVRIAMTVAELGIHAGTVIDVRTEGGLDTDNPIIETFEATGQIHSDLSVGTDVTQTQDLQANAGLSNTGMLLAGQGFKLEERDARRLVELDGEGAWRVIKPYIGGGELLGRPRSRFVVDFAGFSETKARQEFPATYGHILQTVKPERDLNPQKSRREKWWLFGRSNAVLRSALADIDRFILTTETAKHRVFQFRSATTIPDHMAISIALSDGYFLGVLSSNSHLQWTYAKCSLLGVATFEQGHRYNKSQIFDPFPFPDATPEQRARIAGLAEELDATRRAALEETPGLTMTEIYNLRAKLASGAAMDFAEADRATRARAGIVNRLHEQIDEAVAEAYGWPADPAPSEIIARLVALNAERAAEEKAGKVRWLRPDYQEPRFGRKKAEG